MIEKPAKLRGHLLYLEEVGGSPDSVLAGSDVSFASVRALEPISTAKMAELFDLLARRTPVDFAIRCGQATRFQYMGMLAYRLLNCETLRQVLETWSRYSVVIGYPLQSELRLSRGRWLLEFRPRYAMSEAALRFCMESTVAGTPAAIGALTGHAIQPLEYGFPFSPQLSEGRYDLLGDVPLAFNRPAGYVAGQESDLLLRLAAVDGEAQAISDSYCRERLADIAGSQAAFERVHAMLSRSEGKYPSVSEAASRLGFAQRSLQRQLAAEGHSYHGLVESFRRHQAETLLGQGLELKIIAYRLGFKDVGSLRRAFRQWTGCTPTDWRRLTGTPSHGRARKPLRLHPGALNL